ncbi:MAG: hypothetical protein IJF80_01990 [Clostridia bacterium]|nr:hypothetical protein [Clostridia bacterium]
MDFSSANTTLWNPIIQIGILATLILFSNILLRKLPFVKKTLMPTAVLSGFLLLLIRSLNIINIDGVFLEKVTYHALALGFIAMSLRIPEKNSSSSTLIGSKSGALIVSTYLVQAVVGLVVTLGLAYTVMPNLFKASGILLPMAYGQGPGQANNVGATYEALGMTGGRSFGLSLAAAGFLCACIVGVIYINILNRKGKFKRSTDREDVSGSVTVDTFQSSNEIPISQSIDRFSIQFALVCLIYLLTYLVTHGITVLLAEVAPGLANMVSALLWGFNFIIGSALATVCRVIIGKLRKTKIISRQYQNNYLLSRISGLAFDVMIVAGIASINIEDLHGYILPFTILAILGGVVTFYYLKFMSDRLYPEYSEAGFLSMYGMLTGTISSGILLLREIDPDFETPAANNLITGSSFGIIFGAPVLLLVSLAAESDLMTWVALGLVIIYLAFLLLFMFKVGKKAEKSKKQ